MLKHAAAPTISFGPLYFFSFSRWPLPPQRIPRFLGGDVVIDVIVAYTKKAASNYAVKKGLKFQWLADPKREMWKTFDAKTMPTNILIDKGGRVVKVVDGCTRDGKNAQTLSTEIARLLKTEVAQIKEAKK